jgi:hypothetical protein
VESAGKTGNSPDPYGAVENGTPDLLDEPKIKLGTAISNYARCRPAPLTPLEQKKNMRRRRSTTDHVLGLAAERTGRWAGAAVDQAIAVCGGDTRATVRTLIIASNLLESEIAELKKAVSHAYTRGRFRTYTG